MICILAHLPLVSPGLLPGGELERKKIFTGGLFLSLAPQPPGAAPYARALLIVEAKLIGGRSELGRAGLKVGRKPRRKRTKQPAEALTNGVNHWLRVEILAILHEGQFTTGEVASMIGEDVKHVHPHMKILYDSGCIEYVGDRVKGNIRMPVFRAIVTPVIDVEEYRAMSLEDRHDLNGAIGQGFFTEFMSSYRSGKLDADEESHVVWDLLDLDAQGKQELHDHLVASHEEAKNIHARSVNRMAQSKEAGTATVVSLWCFERGRAGRPKEGYRRGLKK